MLTIPCPWCGTRNESEFLCGGPQRPVRPDDAAALTADAWIDRLTVRPNPKGPLTELWWHRRGCGRWFALERDTLTHAVRPLAGEAGDGR